MKNNSGISLCLVTTVLLAALIQVEVEAQSVSPNPKIGTVLWTKTLTNAYPSTVFLTDDERTLVVRGANGPNDPWVPIHLDLISQRTSVAPPALGEADKLAANLVTLADGGLVQQRPQMRRLGPNGWIADTANSIPRNAIATRNNKLLRLAKTGESSGSGNELFLEIDGTTGAVRSQKVGTFPPARFWGSFVGFVQGGSAVIFSEEYEPRAFYLVNPETLSLGFRLRLSPPWKLFVPANTDKVTMAVTADGLVLIAGLTYKPGSPWPVGGLIVVDPQGNRESRAIELPFRQTMVTGIAIGRDGYAYCSLSDRNPSLAIPRTSGGVARVNVTTGEASLIGNVVDGVEAPPVITKDGVLLVTSLGGDNATVHAIATGSVGGLAVSPWPRSTGDNQDSFREQGVDDSDGDGLLDDEEPRYGTDRLKQDTDSDGYSDSVEVQNGSSPTSAADLPEIMEAKIAVKVTFGTNLGRRYQLQSSVDLVTWTDVGSPFDGTGIRQSQLVDADLTSRYWRLRRVD
jgi:hypothetical protein